jgi:2-C-methyl-D-erythritol 2,4-cyclodiphosphate synthase
MRVGFGYDIHRLVSNKKLLLGGVNIEYEKGLLGHSDGDVVLHALCDAILGASGKGDLGEYFPSSDQQYKDIDSWKLLKKVIALLGEQWSIVNLDATIIAEEPKLKDYIEAIRLSIANLCCIRYNQVNVKSKTNDQLGAIGSGEGIASMVIVLLEEKNENL